MNKAVNSLENFEFNNRNKSDLKSKDTNPCVWFDEVDSTLLQPTEYYTLTITSKAELLHHIVYTFKSNMEANKTTVEDIKRVNNFKLSKQFAGICRICRKKDHNDSDWRDCMKVISIGSMQSETRTTKYLRY